MVVGNLGRAKECAGAVVKGTIGIGGVTVPLGPPAGGRVRFITIVRVAGEEVNVIEARNGGIGAAGVGLRSLIEVHLNEIPMGSDGTVRCVSNSEQTIHRRSDGLIQGLGGICRKGVENGVSFFSRRLMFDVGVGFGIGAGARAGLTSGGGNSRRNRKRLGPRRWLRIQGAGDPSVVVAFDVEGRMKGVVNGSVMMIEEAVIHGVKRSRRPKAWREESHIDGMVGFLGGIGSVGAADNVSAVGRAAENKVWTTLLVTELGDTTSGGLALDLNTDHDNITNLEETLTDRLVDAGAVIFPTIQSENLEDLGGEGGAVLAEAEVIMNSR